MKTPGALDSAHRDVEPTIIFRSTRYWWAESGAESRVNEESVAFS